VIFLRLRRYASVVLAAFLATVCVTVVAPVAGKSGYQLVCSATGSKLIADGDHVVADGTSVPASDLHVGGAAHCPLCLPVSPPSPFIAWVSAPVRHSRAVEHGPSSASFVDVVGAPLPARGPPLPS